jgi:hypothetical protein
MLPSDARVVVAATDLARQRATPAGRAFESFISETADWTRTTQAWEGLAAVLNLDPRAAADTLLGRSAVIVSTDADRPFTDAPLAIISEVDAETRRLLNAKLDVVPRSVVAGAPILALEGGRFELAALPPAGGGTRFVLSGDRPLFDRVVAAQAASKDIPMLAGSPEWRHYAELSESDLFLLLREPAEESSSPSSFFALGGEFTQDGWTGRFTATDGMVLAGLASTPRIAVHWPAEAVDALESGASLLVAGSVQLQPAAGRQTLMSTLLGMLNLPPALRNGMEGNAIISLEVDEAGIAGGGRLVIVLPLRDIARSAPLADAWALSIAGITVDRVSETVRIADGIYTAPLAPDRPIMLAAHKDGRLAWCYASPGPMRDGRAPGWIVMTLRLGEGEDPVLTARRVSSLLARDPGRDRSTLFRLVLEPRRLAGVIATHDAPAAGDEPALQEVRASALRWLRRIESRVSRGSPGLVDGSISLDFNIPASAAAPQRGDPRQEQRDRAGSRN